MKITRIILSLLVIFTLAGCKKRDLVKPYYDHCIEVYPNLRKKGFFKVTDKKVVCNCIAHRQLNYIAEDLKYTSLSFYSNINKEMTALKEQAFTVALFDCHNKYKKKG